MQDIWVSLHSIRSRSTNFASFIVKTTPDIATSATTSSTPSSFDTPFKILLGILRYRTLFEASSRSARLQGLPKVGPARFLAVTLGDQSVSTLRSIKTMTQFSSFEHQNSHVACFNAQGLLYECVFDASCFLHRTDLLGNPFLITSLLDFILFFFGSSYWLSFLPRCSDTTL
jgi:hypothetical protein